MKQLKRLLLAFTLLLPLFAGAQESIPRTVHVNGGIKLGVNIAQLDGKSWDAGYKTNALGGVFIRVHNRKVGVQLEAFFSQTEFITGKTFSGISQQYFNAGKDSLSKGSFKVSYLNIPLLVQFKLISRVWIQLGPQYSGVVNVKDNDQLLKDAEGLLFKKSNFSGVGGVWLDLPLHINMGARYVVGLSDTKGDDVKAEDAWKQKSIQFHIGLTF